MATRSLCLLRAIALATGVAGTATADDQGVTGSPDGFPQFPPLVSANNSPPPTPQQPPALNQLMPSNTSGPRIASIPAHFVTRTSEVPCTTDTKTVCVPRFEEVRVPIYEMRRVKKFRTLYVPVAARGEIANLELRRIPVYQDVMTPTYQTRTIPQFKQVYDAATCTYRSVPCGTQTLRVPTGVKKQRKQCGWRMAYVRVRTGLTGLAPAKREVKRVFVGYREEAVKVGERLERRQCGWTHETQTVASGQTKTVTHAERVPAEMVTVVSDGVETKPPPLAGTTRTLTRSEFVTAMKQVGAMVPLGTGR